jgi:hypothetical protein
MKSEDIKKIKEFPRVEIDFNVKFAPLKKIQDKTTINTRYCLLAHLHLPISTGTKENLN